MSENKEHKESALRSAFKGISWRIIATTTIIIIIYFKTGKIDTALEIGAIEFILKYLLYFGHERLWAQLPRGTFRSLYSNFRNKKK